MNRTQLSIPENIVRKVSRALTLKSKQGDVALSAAARGKEAGQKT